MNILHKNKYLNAIENVNKSLNFSTKTFIR